MNFEMRLGAMSEGIAKQLKKQKLLFDKKTVSGLQRTDDSISYLHIYSYISSASASGARKKLLKKINTHVNSMNKKSDV